MEPKVIATQDKVEVARLLVEAGITRLEATSFVSPRLVPQLKDAFEVTRRVRELGATVLALVPNRKRAMRAAEAGVDEMVFFVSASETHNRSNVGRDIAGSLEELEPVVDIAVGVGIRVRCSVATAFGCPFEGDVSVESVLRIVRYAERLGIRDITLGDTTGMATPPVVKNLCNALEAMSDVRLSLHFHNTRGLGLVNVATGLELGIRSFESSIGGLGGCPFAVGATGNICTEDLVYMTHELGFETGVDLDRLIKAARHVETIVGRELPGQVMKAGPRLNLHATAAIARK